MNTVTKLPFSCSIITVNTHLTLTKKEEEGKKPKKRPMGRIAHLKNSSYIS